MDKRYLVKSLAGEGYIKSPAVKKAFINVNRTAFLPDEQRGMAYCDTPLPISSGQTISAPSMIAIMLEAAKLKKGLKVLEIGAGSGYNAALIAEIVGQEKVITVERIADLATFARKNLDKNGYNKIKVVQGDGTLGYKKDAPYDRIIVTAASPKITHAWKDQLIKGGLIVAPVGGRYFHQDLIVAKKESDGSMTETYHGGCVFVPLIGEDGWDG